jgi:rRNA biogenesis protein RRP5
MAFHLALADVSAARQVAERAFQRIEFRQEREKLNVWCALLTLELKFGVKKELQETIDRACQHNNPIHVYLRVCEMLEKDASSAASINPDEMYAKTCKKFKSKKQVWLAHIEYLLKNNRLEEAHSLSKRALQSLPKYKHIETMSKFAQLLFEYGSPERARTLFDGILQKNRKRLDLFYILVDKEVKHGDMQAARHLFKNQIGPDKRMKLTDKQMKSFFKKWYSIENQHGTKESTEDVKDAARKYVEQSS